MPDPHLARKTGALELAGSLDLVTKQEGNGANKHELCYYINAQMMAMHCWLSITTTLITARPQDPESRGALSGSHAGTRHGLVRACATRQVRSDRANNRSSHEIRWLFLYGCLSSCGTRILIRRKRCTTHANAPVQGAGRQGYSSQREVSFENININTI